MSSQPSELKELSRHLKNYLQEHYPSDFRVEGTLKKIAFAAPPPKSAPLPAAPPSKPAPRMEAPKPQPPLPTAKPKVEKPAEIKTFEKEKIEVEKAVELNSVRHFFQTEAPHIKLGALPPELTSHETPAKIIFLAFSPSHIPFLKNISKAIEIRFGIPSRIDSVNQTYKYKEEGKLIIASEYGLEGFPELKQRVKESARPGQYLLGKTPLMILTDLTLYHKEPQLKHSLWHALCHEIRSLKLSSN